MPYHGLPRFLHQVLLDVRMLVGHIQRPLVAVLRIRSHRRIQRNFHPLMPRVSQRVQRQVRRNPEQPRRKLCARHIIRSCPVHAYKHFLRQILRLLPVPHHSVQKIDQRTPVALEQKRERLFIARLHVQHQLDVGPGHSRHTLPNTCVVRKLRTLGKKEAKLGRNHTRTNHCRINKLATPPSTRSAVRDPSTRFTSDSKAVAASYTVPPAYSGSAYRNCACSTPNSVATPKAPAAATAFPRLCPLASTTDAIVNPSGSLCRKMATKITVPSQVDTRNPAAIATPSKKV